MKKLLFLLVALVCCTSIQAQKVMIFENGKLIKTYQNTPTQTVKVVVEEEPLDEFLTAGSFSVSDTKKVRFTKGNLYWNGKAFKLEANQTDFPTTKEANHVGHFFWTKTAAASYAASYDDGTNTTADVPFFAESKGGIIAEGVSGLFALSQGEWSYLIYSRTNAASLWKKGVSVTNNGTTYEHTLIIAPDGFEGSLQSSYTLEEVNRLGLVCLSLSGAIKNGSFVNSDWGIYWSSTAYYNDKDRAYTMENYYKNDKPHVSSYPERKFGFALRLVRLAQ